MPPPQDFFTALYERPVFDRQFSSVHSSPQAAIEGKRPPRSLLASADEKERKTKHGVDGEELETFEPGGFAALGDLVSDDDGQEDGAEFKAVKDQRHGEWANNETGENEDRRNEQGDLCAGTDGDVDRDVHLVARGEVGRHPVLGSIANQVHHRWSRRQCHREPGVVCLWP